MKTIATLIVASLGVCAFAATAAGVPSGDSIFASKAAQGNLAEVSMGQLAAAKGLKADVKTFGQSMVRDHTMANSDLMTAAKPAGIRLPSAPTAEQEQMKDSLAKLDGSAFDQRYAEMMVKDHEEDIALFRDEANHGKDPNIRAFATKTLPTLETHLEMAKKLKGTP